jgi:hypothetical protein
LTERHVPQPPVHAMSLFPHSDARRRLLAAADRRAPGSRPGAALAVSEAAIGARRHPPVGEEVAINVG